MSNMISNTAKRRDGRKKMDWKDEGMHQALFRVCDAVSHSSPV